MRLSKAKKPVIGFFDIETTYLMVRTFRLGDQVIRHDNLVPGFDQYNIICIAIATLDKPGVKVLSWDQKTHSPKKMLIEFAQWLEGIDILIGKNSDKFDIKQINTLFMLNGLPAPNWPNTDDLEKQMRKFFYLPSYSLDYFDKLLFGEGKYKMEMKHWIDIQERTADEKKSFDRMCKYCGLDIKKTKAHWKRVLSNIQPKFNYNAVSDVPCCKACGSDAIQKNGTRVSGKTLYEKYVCTACLSYAGKRPKGTKGKLS